MYHGIASSCWPRCNYHAACRLRCGQPAVIRLGPVAQSHTAPVVERWGSNGDQLVAHTDTVSIAALLKRASDKREVTRDNPGTVGCLGGFLTEKDLSRLVRQLRQVQMPCTPQVS